MIISRHIIASERRDISMIDAETRLFNECAKTNIDWTALDKCVADLEPIINDKYDSDETLLSEAIQSCDSGNEKDPRLVKLIKIFLDHGYDVSANDRFNGGACLRALCWSTYTSEILDAAEFLLDVGADPFFSDDEDEKAGVLSSISWKLGSWVTGYLSDGNLFEAYYSMIEAAQNGEDYHGIHTFTKCKGKTVEKIEQLISSYEDRDFDEANGRFKDSYVIWCEGIPLVVSMYIDFIVNPLVTQKAVDRIDRSENFSQIIGKTVKDLVFLTAAIAQLRFSDGSCLLFSNNHMTDAEEHFAWAEYYSDCGQDPPDIETVKQVMFESGNSYPESCRSFREKTAYLDCGDYGYMLFSVGEDFSEYELVCQKFPKERLSDMSRVFRYKNFCLDRFIRGKDGKLRGLEMHSGGDYLYLLTANFSNIEVILAPGPIEDIDRKEDHPQ